MIRTIRRQTLFSQVVVLFLVTTQPWITLPQSVLHAQALPARHQTNQAPLPDAFKEDWKPPQPVLTPREINLNKAVKVTAPRFDLPRGRSLTEGELKNTKVLGTPLRSIGGKTAGDDEKRELGQKLLDHVTSKGRENASAANRLKDFVDRHPTSGYALSFLVEAGDIEWLHGFFMDSLSTHQRAWDLAKGEQGDDDRRLAEMALGRLLERRALMGQKEEIRALLASLQERKLGGYAEDVRDRAKEILWFMDHKAEHNVFCGFTAANAVCVPRGEPPVFPDVHDENEKKAFIRDGLSAFELAAHSHEVGGTLRVVRRGPQAKIVVPSVVHWSFTHYSAITEEAGDKYRVKDEHLRFDSWVPKEAVDRQSSGIFLIPKGVALPEGYSAVTDAEAKTIFGRHCVHYRDDEGTQSKTCAPCCQGMAVYQFDLMNPGLFIKDMPISHVPPYGPPVQFTASYAQRSTVIADLQTLGNLGPRWTHTYQEVIALTGSGPPAAQAKWIQSDGAYFNYSNVTATNTYTQIYKERPHLLYLTAGQGGPGYELRFPDGSRKLFTQPNTATPTKYLLTQIVDAVGNAVTLQYDGNLRLTSILDALGQATTISYATEAGDNVTGDTFKIRKVTDPFSRVAKFKYTTTGQLEKIIDPVLIESKFHYASGDFIDRLTTPYGITEFTHGEVLGLNSEPGRFIESKDANGDRERVEANDFGLPDGSGGTPVYTESPTPPITVSINGANVSFLPKNDTLYYRNTFVWDRKQMFYAPRDYSQARIYNWLASSFNTIANSVASIKDPLEGRVYFNYPEQNSMHAIGALNSPSKVVRAVENAAGGNTWTMSQASYNDLGLPTGMIDPEGREQKYEYYMAADGAQYSDHQDIRYVKVKNGAAYETLLTVSQYKTHPISGKSMHLPEVMTDASGVQSTLSYNNKGQVTEVTLSKGANTETTRFIYDSNLDDTPDSDGYLIRVEHTSPVNPAQFVTLESRTYDALKRVRTVTDAEGYTVTFDYDALDRVTLVTHPDLTTEQLVYTDGTKQTLDVWASKDRSGRWTRTRYNHLRQPVLQLDSLVRLTQWEWCKCGSLSKLIDAQSKTTFWKRDMQGRVTDKILPDGKKHSYTYQPLSGRLKTVAQPEDVLNNTTTYTNVYHPDGQLQTLNYTSATMADVSYAKADYLGRPTTATDGQGTTSASYVPYTSSPNGAGQTSTVNGPLANDTRRYSYDWQGRATKQEIVNDDGVTVTRLQEVTGRDSLGRATGMVSNLGTFTPTYNTGNITGLPDALAMPGGFSSVFTKYAAGAGANALRLQGIEHKQGASTVQKHEYAYNLAGNLTSWNRTNAASVESGWTLRHDSADQLTDLEETVGGSPSKRESWHYDTAGNLASTLVQPTGQSAILRMRQHTGRNQLTSLGGAGKTLVEGTVDEPATVTVNGQPAAVTKLGPSGPWRYQKELNFPGGQTALSVVATDGSNNVTTNNYTVTVDAAAGAQALEYDHNGNLTKQRNAANVVTRLCEWDAANQLLAVQSAETLAAGVKRSEFTYDGAGRRVRQIEKEHNGTAWATVSDWRYVWVGLELAQKRDAATNAALVNYFGNGEQVIGGDALVYQTDHLGSPRSWYRVSDGVRGEADYSAYGVQTVTSTGPGVPERGYTGHLNHAASGLVLAPFRAYDSDLGRWISEDPIGEAGGLNLYGYVGGNPTGLIDPTGELAFIPILLAAWAVAEVGLALYDAYDTLMTVADPCASAGEKMTAAGLFVAGAFLPGGGYSQLDNMAKAGLRRGAAKSTGQNAAELGRNMSLEGRAVGEGQAAAHIVPSTGTKGHWAKGAESRELLQRYNVNINDAANGARLGHPRPHNLTHTAAFQSSTNARLNAVRDSMQKAGRGGKAIRKALRQELRVIGRELE